MVTASDSTTPMLFISHSSRDADWARTTHSALGGEYRVFLDEHRNDGIPAGADWQAELSRQIQLSSGVVVLCSPNWLASPWCIAEAIIAEEKGKPLFPILRDLRPTRSRTLLGLWKERFGEREPTSLPGFLRRRQCIDLTTTSPQAAEERLLAGLAEQLGTDFGVPARPYPGLEPFTANDAAVFCGRDAEVRSVLDLMERARRNTAQRFVLILGASGSGKSSLVRAGVVPLIERVDRGSSDSWTVAPPITAREGMVGVGSALRRTVADFGLDDDVGDARALLELCRTITDRAGAGDGYLLLVLDQLEEVFRSAMGSPGRRMLRVLLDAAGDDTGRLAVLATMRSDYLDEFQLFEGAAGRYEKITLDPMPSERFAEIIAQPAQRCSVELEGGLVEKLVSDAGHADALPLLAFTLKQLYDRAGADNLITIEEYETYFPEIHLDADTTLSGVAAAIKLRADEILDSEGFAPFGRDWRDGTEGLRMRDLRSTFMRLVEVSPDGQLLRRQAPRTALPASCRRVVERLIDERLLVCDEDDLVSVAHEAMFRAWHSFRVWLGQNENALMLRTQIRRAAEDWERQDRAAYLRWPEGRVVDAVGVMEQTGIIGADPFDEIERAFLGALGEERIMAELRKSTLTVLERAELGRRLALPEDRRPGVGLTPDGLPDLAWLTVPGGTVELRGYTEAEAQGLRRAQSRLTGGSVPDPASGRFHDRKLQQAQTVGDVPPFSVSKYPVTRAQFTAFVTSRDFSDRAWWPDGNVPDEPPVPRRDFPNHPATRLSWFTARAFCRWLSAHTATEIRLPSEFEWQQAATGGGDRLYPWGDVDTDIRALANTFDGRITDVADIQPTTTPVGVFPLGASPVGAMDMSGNVWEWCDSYFFGDRSDDSRVVRGGSWVIGAPICTCIYAGELIPTADTYFVGFRPLRVGS